MSAAVEFAIRDLGSCQSDPVRTGAIYLLPGWSTLLLRLKECTFKAHRCTCLTRLGQATLHGCQWMDSTGEKGPSTLILRNLH